LYERDTLARVSKIAVVGAGFGGVGALVMLHRAGYHDVTVFERGERVA
jgi:cation diffusion facilitator CzcD-associated flavoprotein CzcO